MGEGKKGGSEEVDLKTKTFDEIFMELVLPGVNRHNFVTRWNFISIFLTLKVFRFSHLSSSTRIFWRYQLRFVSMYPREKSINFPLFFPPPPTHILSDILPAFMGFFPSLSPRWRRKSFSSCLPRSNRRNLISPTWYLFARRIYSKGLRRRAQHASRPITTNPPRLPEGPKKVDQKVTYLAGEENEMEFETWN